MSDGDDDRPSADPANAGGYSDEKRALFTSARTDTGTDEYGTPRRLWEPIARACGSDQFDLDPCARQRDGPIGQTCLTDADDGLAHDWHGDVWVNPPFSDAGEWARYARDQAQRDAVDRVFLLLPNRSDTSYYHDVIDQVSLKAEVGPEPVSFDGADANAPFPVIILLFGPPNDDIRAAFDRLGAVLEPVTDIRPTQTDLGDFDRD